MSAEAERIAAAILKDVTSRRGWRQEWDGFAEEIQAEIVAEWERLIDEVLGRAGRQRT